MRYLIRFVSSDQAGLYYSDKVSWKGVTRNDATPLSYKDARKIRDQLRQPRIGLPCVIEPIED